jgi:hypothetical protein
MCLVGTKMTAMREVAPAALAAGGAPGMPASHRGWIVVLTRRGARDAGRGKHEPAADVAEGGARHHAARRRQQHLLRSRARAKAHLRTRMQNDL